MRIAIANDGKGNIVTVKELINPEGKGEISHFLADLEIIKLELLEMWEEYGK